MRAGPDASTVTPGSTAPEVSRTTPAMALVPCALASADAKSTHAQTAVARSVKAARPDTARYLIRRRRFVVLPHLTFIVPPFACTHPCPDEERHAGTFCVSLIPRTAPRARSRLVVGGRHDA